MEREPSHITLADRAAGCIVGGAIGDCLGGPYEGPVNTPLIRPHQDWNISDDTQMTLATCEAIIQGGGVDPEAIAASFLRWYSSGRITGIGASTYKALSELGRGGHWALVGRKGEMAAGNGAAMRIAPLAFRLDPAEAKDRVVIRDVCRITHHNEEAYVGALAVTVAIRAARKGTWDNAPGFLRYIAGALPDTSVKDRILALAGLDPEMPLRQIGRSFGCSGYVVESVPLALAGAGRIWSLGFQGVLEELVSNGGDTDTIASMAGQVMGAWIGLSGLPKDLVARVPARDRVMEIACRFGELV